MALLHGKDTIVEYKSEDSGEAVFVGGVRGLSLVAMSRALAVC